MKKSRILFFTSLLLILTFGLVLTPFTVQSYVDGNDPEFGRPITSYMVGTHYEDLINLPSQPNTTIDLPTYWAIQHTDVIIYDLVDSQDIIVNGTFNQGSGTSSPPWSYGEVDPGSIASGLWVTNTPLSGNTCVYSQIPAASGGTSFQKGTKAFWSSSISVPRGTVQDAVLDLWYYADFASNFDRGEFRAYVEVEGHTVWSRGFNEISDAGQRVSWVHLIIDILKDTNGLDVFSLPSDQDISIVVGVAYVSGTATYTGWTSNNRLYYDNISLILTAEVNPNQVNLSITDPNLSSHQIQSSDYGNGTVSFDGNFGPATQPVFQEIVYTYSTNTSNQVSFKNNITGFVIRNLNTTNVSLEVQNSTNTIWNVKYFTGLNFDNEPKGSGPTIYTDYYFNITFPLDWVINNIIDPNEISHSPNESNYSLFSNATSQILVVEVSIIDLYGLYSIEAYSPNYLKSIQLEIFDQEEGWINSSYFTSGDLIRFTCKISDQFGNPPSELGDAFLTIKNPQGNSWPSSSLNISINGSGFAISDNISVSSSDLVGGYIVEFDWSNGFEAGSLISTEFGIRGQALVTIKHPVGTESYILSGSGLVIEVELSDPTTASPINDAQVFYRFSWEAPGVWHSTDRVGNRYLASATILESIIGAQSITIMVNHQFYSLTSETNINIEVWQEWYIYFPWGGRILGWVFVSYVAFAAVIGAGGYSVWNYYLKYPKMVRKIRGMIKTIRRGRIPGITNVKERSDLLNEFMEKDTALAYGIPIVEETILTENEIETSNVSINASIDRAEAKSAIEEYESSIKKEDLEGESSGELPKIDEGGSLKKGISKTKTKKQVKSVDQTSKWYINELNKIEGLGKEEIDSLIKEFKEMSKKEIRKIINSLKEEYKS